MSQVCRICNHTDRLGIDRELAQGKSKAAISRQYGVTTDSLSNHEATHLSRQLTQAYEKKELAESMDLLARIEDILSKAKQIFDRNYKLGKDGLALKALGEQRSTIELLAKIASFLHQARALELEAEATAEEFPLATSEELAVFTDAELKLMVSMGVKLQKDPSLIVEGHEGHTRRSAPPPNVEFPTYDEPEPTTYEEPEVTVEATPDPEPEPEPEPPRRMRRTKFPGGEDEPEDDEQEHELKVRPIEPEKLQPYSEKPLKTAAALDVLTRAEARARAKSK